MKLILGISGASGVVMAYHLLKTVKAETDAQVHLVMTESARETWTLETDIPLEELFHMADAVYEPHDMAAAISSGSFLTDGMIVLPCSMKTLAGIVSGYTDNLLLRAADVCLKEGRKLVICPREMPMGRVHLRNLYEASCLGCTVVPPVMTFYNGPMSIQDQIDHIVGKLLLPFGIVPRSFKPWK